MTGTREPDPGSGDRHLSGLLGAVVGRADDLLDTQRRLDRLLASIDGGREVPLPDLLHRLVDEARRRERWLLATAEIASTLAYGGDEDRSLALVVDLAITCSDAERGALLLVDHTPGVDDTAELIVEVALGFEASTTAASVVAVPGSPLHRALWSTQPIDVDDPTVLPAWLAPAGGGLLLVPFRGVSRTEGLLVLVRPVQRESDPDSVLASTFASQAAIALALGRAQRDRERLAIVDDRDRIARDLHDLVIQRLFATGVELQSAASQSDDAAVRALLDRSVHQIDEAMLDLRRSIFSLRSDPGRRGLRAGVDDELRIARASLGFMPNLRVEGPVDLVVPSAMTSDVLAVVREGLANVAKHARATSAAVLLEVADMVVTVEVTDDGRGPGAADHESGIANLRARAEGHGGGVRLAEPDGGRGSRLRWWAPLDDS